MHFLCSRRGARTPAFVTWMKRRSGHKGFEESDVDLRGCIGSLEPIPIMKLRKILGCKLILEVYVNMIKADTLWDLAFVLQRITL